MRVFINIHTPPPLTAWSANAILAFLRDHAPELRAMGVLEIGLFGSYVRDSQKSSSDIDLLFTMDKLTWRRWMTVWNYLEDQFGMKIDLVPAEDLRPEIALEVLQEVRYAEGF